jgi:GDPmannose 4,6-dehydratase
MWQILQYRRSEDWVIATNKESTVKNFINLVVKKLDFKIKWVGKNLNEKAINQENDEVIIDLDQKFLRPTEVDFLKGNYSKAKKLLKWEPRHSINSLVEDMISEELTKFG